MTDSSSLELGVELPLLLLALLDDLLEFRDLGHQLGGRRLVLGGLRLADLLGGRVAARLRLLQLGQVQPPRLVELKEFLRQRREPALLEAGVEGFGVVSDPLDVEHGNGLVAIDGECAVL